jgi:FdhE protein
VGSPLKLYRDIFAAQKKHLSGLGVSVPLLDDIQINTRLEEGLPLLEPELLEIDYAKFNDLFRELKGIVARKSKLAEPRDREFLKKRELGQEEVEELGRAWLEGREDYLETRAAELEVDYSILSLLLHATFAACFRKLAVELHSRADLDQYPGAECPICGAPPVMGFNRDEDGLRVLECSLCGSRWGAPRMVCLFCGTPDQSKLRYLFVNDDQTRRIYVCERCKKYIKIVDRKGQTDEIVLPLEDLFTAYLDEAARAEGYDRGCRTVFS